MVIYDARPVIKLGGRWSYSYAGSVPFDNEAGKRFTLLLRGVSLGHDKVPEEKKLMTGYR